MVTDLTPNLFVIMAYTLPHAVLALLEEENSPNIPKSYYISSGTKSTKITLIYTRCSGRKRENRASHRENPHTISAAKLQKHNRSYSMSVRPRVESHRRSPHHSGDHTQRESNFCGNDASKSSPRICASTPGRGYNDRERIHHATNQIDSHKGATDPIRGSPHHKDEHSININPLVVPGSEGELSDHFIALSPDSVSSEKPLTPGREFEPSPNSPRPPTPNASNYATIMSSANPENSTENSNNLLNPHIAVYHTRSRQPTIEYDDDDDELESLVPPRTPQVSSEDERHHNPTDHASQSKRRASVPAQVSTVPFRGQHGRSVSVDTAGAEGLTIASMIQENIGTPPRPTTTTTVYPSAASPKMISISSRGISRTSERRQNFNRGQSYESIDSP